MTADRARRQRSTWISLAGSVVALAAVAVLVLVALGSMANSRAGRDATADLVAPSRELPWTATALIGVVDDAGVLRATAVGVLTPQGRGGTLLSYSASADGGAGWGQTLRPLVSVFAVDGPEAWRATMEQMTGLTFDVAEVVDQDRLVGLLEPLGDIPVVVPFEFTDATTDTTYAAGEDVLPPPDVVRIISSTNGVGPAWQLDAGRDAMWSAVASRVGAGIGSLEQGVFFDATYPPPSLDRFVDALFAAPVEFRSISSAQVDPSRVREQLSPAYAEILGPEWDDGVVVHGRAEMTLMSASVAPARSGAPADGPTVRLVSGFSSDQVAALGESRSDVLVDAIEVLMFVHANVISVVDAPGVGVPDVTRIVVSDEALVDDLWATFDGVLGEIQVAPAPQPIEGVDIEITLGGGYLPALAAQRVAEAEAAAAEAAALAEGSGAAGAPGADDDVGSSEP